MSLFKNIIKNTKPEQKDSQIIICTDDFKPIKKHSKLPEKVMTRDES